MKNLKLIISQKAIEDLSDIWSYIALDNPDATDNFTEKLYESCSLALMPEMGRNCNELFPGLRSLTYIKATLFSIRLTAEKSR